MNTSFDHISAALVAEGYKEEEPNNNGWLEDDKEASKTWECDTCDQIGMVFHPYTNGDDYRAILVCPNCGRVTEI